MLVGCMYLVYCLMSIGRIGCGVFMICLCCWIWLMDWCMIYCVDNCEDEMYFILRVDCVNFVYFLLCYWINE